MDKDYETEEKFRKKNAFCILCQVYSECSNIYELEHDGGNGFDLFNFCNGQIKLKKLERFDCCDSCTSNLIKCYNFVKRCDVLYAKFENDTFVKQESCCTLCLSDELCSNLLFFIHDGRSGEDILRYCTRIKLIKLKHWYFCNNCLSDIIDYETFIRRCNALSLDYIENIADTIKEESAITKQEGDEHDCNPLEYLQVSLEGRHLTRSLKRRLLNTNEEHSTNHLEEEANNKCEIGKIKEYCEDIFVKEEVSDEELIQPPAEKQLVKKRTTRKQQTKSDNYLVKRSIKKTSKSKTKGKRKKCKAASSKLTVVEKTEEHECNTCGKVFPNIARLNSHMVMHSEERPFMCNQCGKAFRRKTTLDVHRRLHKGERPHVCEECGRTFSLKSNLTRHIKSHSEPIVDTMEKNQVCNICGKAFRAKLTLILHVRTHTGERPYKCHYCDKAFISRSCLVVHLRRHTGEKPYICQVCEKRFTRKTHLDVHMLTHTGEKRFVCEHCGKAFARKIHLQVHVRRHTGDRPFKCGMCDRGFYAKGILNIHLRVKHHVIADEGATEPRPIDKCELNCDFCVEVFEKKDELITHVNNCHPGETLSTCETCQKSFVSNYLLTNHLKKHKNDGTRELNPIKKQKFNCDFCSELYDNKKDLICHVGDRHPNEKPFTCETCKRTFVSQTLLASHIKNHADEKSFMCDECGKTFTQKTGLNYHMMSHTGNKPFQCQYCGKEFKIKSTLEMHIRIHTNERPFKCQLCEHAFPYKSSLKYHMRTHHPRERPFKCSMCDEAFTCNKYLKNHMLLHTMERVFKCELCGNIFSQKGNLQTHMRKVHEKKKYNCEFCENVFTDQRIMKMHLAAAHPQARVTF